MNLWDDLIGQTEAVCMLRAAASGEHLAHSWLITGPAGSGRSILAYAFAAELIARPGQEQATAVQVAARTHPDLGVLSTESVNIGIEDVRKLVSASQFSPAVGRFRVMVVTDADRMSERTANVLLKALEEPPESTVWILCAPSDVDLLPTIRSRVRLVRLRVPDIQEVAKLLVRRDGVSEKVAIRAAREAQAHVGMARRLAIDDNARARRERTLELVLALRFVRDAVVAAAELLELAKEDAAVIATEREEADRQEFLRSMGVTPGESVPQSLRASLRTLADKRRDTRTLRDGLDRILEDLLSLYRDILLSGLGVAFEPVNLGVASRVRELAKEAKSADILAIMDQIGHTKRRLAGNVSPLLALEALMVTIVRRQVIGER